MKILKGAAATSLALLLGAGPALAAGSAGADPFNFLFLDANARAVSMGGAYTALATDANALLYNPAGLARIGRNEATFMHNSYVAGIFQEYGAYASPLGWGVNFNYLNSGNVANTTISNPDGTGLGSTGLTDMAFGAGYGHKIGGSLSLGAEMKYIRESIAEISGSGVALDFGAMYALPPVQGLTLGAAIQNVGPTVKYQSAKENLPLNIRGGAAYSFDAGGAKNAASFDVSKERTSSPVVAFGVETILAKVLPIRLGFTTNNSAGFGLTTGVGFIHDGLAFDYAFVPFGDLGNAHRISMSYRWGEEKKEDRYSAREERKPVEHTSTALPPAQVSVEDGELSRVRYSEKTGRASLKEGDIASAKTSFTQAIRIASSAGIKDSIVADAYAGMGQCLLKEGKKDYAIKFFNKALALGPTPETQSLAQKELDALAGNKARPRDAVDELLGN